MFSRTKDQKGFTDVFDQKNKPGNYNLNDDIYDVFGHGGIDGNGEGFFADFKLGGPILASAKEFDDRMSAVSSSYKKAISKGAEFFTLTLYACESGTGKNSMAQKISAAHPFATIVGFDGFVMFGKTNGTPSINGISSNISTNDNKGYRVVFQGGREVSRTLYTNYTPKKL